MKTIKIALLGFGTVGEGVYNTIHTHQNQLASILDRKVEVAAVLIKDKRKDRGIGGHVLVTDDFEEILALQDLDIVVEAIVGKEPAFSYVKQAIDKGCHVITANKEMFASHGTELKQLAGRHGVTVGFEATVAGGVPVIQTVQHLLNVNQVKKLEGILNGTSNYILSEMRSSGQSFEEALRAAQEKGYAEADPTNDVEGYDAFFKLMILSEIAFGEKPAWEDIPREGITAITGEQITAAENLGLRFKLIASIEKVGDRIVGFVRPTLVSENHPLYNIEGVENSVSIEGDIVGRITLQGPGAGMYPTASAVIEDVIHCYRAEPVLPHVDKQGILNDRARKGQGRSWLIMPAGDAAARQGASGKQEEPCFIVGDEATITQWKQEHQGASFFEVLGIKEERLQEEKV
ncbi:homoserine dehydrogenase [Bacillus massilinigeriensis]|uniref:homoserine dehydrogenase n=1 Tax=Bacillus mediterraneensis TaxID=1805474 RepID=UPI0008F837BB|nr:homoserine dehydrogenase [Bacillus mediterraneensis]